MVMSLWPRFLTHPLCIEKRLQHYAVDEVECCSVADPLASVDACVDPHRWLLKPACSGYLQIDTRVRVVHGFGWPMCWVGLSRDFSVFGGFGWVGSTTAKVLKLWKDHVNAFKARSDKMWLHQTVKFVLYWVGLGPSADGMGWKWTHGQLWPLC